MRLKILACFLFILLAQEAFGQIIIRGRVIASDDGLPLPHVAVFSDSIKNGTLTNIRGEFEIQMELGDILIFDFIGFERQKSK